VGERWEVALEGNPQRRAAGLATAKHGGSLLDGYKLLVLRLRERATKLVEPESARHVEQRLGRRGSGEALVPDALERA
jgi:hypothetical protein